MCVPCYRVGAVLVLQTSLVGLVSSARERGFGGTQYGGLGLQAFLLFGAVISNINGEGGGHLAAKLRTCQGCARRSCAVIKDCVHDTAACTCEGACLLHAGTGFVPLLAACCATGPQAADMLCKACGHPPSAWWQLDACFKESPRTSRCRPCPPQAAAAGAAAAAVAAEIARQDRAAKRNGAASARVPAARPQARQLPGSVPSPSTTPGALCSMYTCSSIFGLCTCR